MAHDQDISLDCSRQYKQSAPEKTAITCLEVKGTMLNSTNQYGLAWSKGFENVPTFQVKVGHFARFEYARWETDNKDRIMTRHRVLTINTP